MYTAVAFPMISQAGRLWKRLLPSKIRMYDGDVQG